jgi:hypothetical protein
VPRSTFGLSADDILALDDKELNQVMPLKRLAPYRDDAARLRPNYTALGAVREKLGGRGGGGKKRGSGGGFGGVKKRAGGGGRRIEIEVDGDAPKQQQPSQQQKQQQRQQKPKQQQQNGGGSSASGGGAAASAAGCAVRGACGDGVRACARWQYQATWQQMEVRLLYSGCGKHRGWGGVAIFDLSKCQSLSPQNHDIITGSRPPVRCRNPASVCSTRCGRDPLRVCFHFCSSGSDASGTTLFGASLLLLRSLARGRAKKPPRTPTNTQ